MASHPPFARRTSPRGIGVYPGTIRTVIDCCFFRINQVVEACAVQQGKNQCVPEVLCLVRWCVCESLILTRYSLADLCKVLDDIQENL
jgi:hypothetical protein